MFNVDIIIIRAKLQIANNISIITINLTGSLSNLSL